MLDIKEIYEIFKTCPRITIDSRHCPKDSIFVALRGDNTDGNLFAAKALENGSRYAIVDRKEIAVDDRYIVVEVHVNVHFLQVVFATYKYGEQRSHLVYDTRHRDKYGYDQHGDEVFVANFARKEQGEDTYDGRLVKETGQDHAQKECPTPIFYEEKKAECVDGQCQKLPVGAHVGNNHHIKQ